MCNSFVHLGLIHSLIFEEWCYKANLLKGLLWLRIKELKCLIEMTFIQQKEQKIVKRVGVKYLGELLFYISLPDR